MNPANSRTSAQSSLHDRFGLGAFALYLTLSLLFFGRGLIGHLSDRYVGVGSDPGAFIFFLEWWKYIFTHHVNPFFTYLQWAPSGANLAVTTFVPLFGISAIPITMTLGPVASYNLLMLLCPALGAWTAFVLYRHLSSSYWPAIVGGYIFGFSPYFLAHLLGHLNLVAVFPIPLIVEVVLLRLSDEMRVSSYIVLLAVLLIAQFLCFPEVMATATFFGAAALAVAWLTARQWREGLQGLLIPTSCAYVASAVVLSPYLYYFFAFGQLALPGGLRSEVSAHPLNFLIPSPTTALGTIPRFRELASGSHLYENGSYIAFPMILIVVSYARTHWQEWQARLLVNLSMIIGIASMGSALNISGNKSIPLPWSITVHLPLLDKALPARFSIYCFLILGIILSLWLSEDVIRKNLRAAGACGVVLLTLPNLSTSFWTTAIDTPAFFSTRLYTRYLSPGDNVLILPYGIKGNSDIWQATSGFYFRMAGGYVGLPLIPAAVQQYFPLMYSFYNLAEFPLSDEMLKAFLTQKRVNAVIVADEGAHLWTVSHIPGPWSAELTALGSNDGKVINSLLATLGVAAVHVGGLSLYKVPLDKFNAYRNVDTRALEARIIAIQLDTLINAAKKYLADGHPPSDLSPVEAQRLKLLPPYWASGVGALNPRASLVNGLVLSSLDNGDVLVGVMGARETIEALDPIYKPFARKAESSPLMSVAPGVESTRWILLLEYDRTQLARAAAVARERGAGRSPTPGFRPRPG